MNNNKQNSSITSKLQKLVKKRKRTLVVIKAGSIKNASRTSSSTGSLEGEYSPSYEE